MTNEDMDHFTPEEALDAFLDGELDVSQEQPLFDELQSSPELRGDMRDALSIRAAVHKDLIAPPAETEGAVLSALGFTTGGIAAGAVASSGAAAVVATGSAPFWSRLGPILYAGGGLIAGFLLAFFMLDGGVEPSSGLASNSGGAGIEGVAGVPQQAPEAPAPSSLVPDTVYAVRYITRVVPVVQEPSSDAPSVAPQPSTPDLSTTSTAQELDPVHIPLGITSVEVDQHQLLSSQRSMATTSDMRTASDVSRTHYTSGDVPIANFGFRITIGRSNTSVGAGRHLAQHGICAVVPGG